MIRQLALTYANRVMASRPPDFSIGPKDDRYMLRWWIIPRNKWFNIYLHKFLHDDDDEALHDHPWASCSWILDGNYMEVMKSKTPNVQYVKTRYQGSFTFRSAAALHRVVLFRTSNGPIKTITFFFTGPLQRKWGFDCPKGWIPYTTFANVDERGSEKGKGCPE